MYLAKIDLVKKSPAVMRLLRSPHNIHGMLCRVTDRRRTNGNTLFRLTGTENPVASLYVQTNDPIDESVLGYGMHITTPQRKVDELLGDLETGNRFAFSLLAQPERSKYVLGGRRGIRRVLRTDSECQEWLLDQAARHGFAVEGAQLRSLPSLFVSRPPRMFQLHPHEFMGILRVTDPACFLEAVEHGIGKYRSYGLGMLMVYPIGNEALC